MSEVAEHIQEVLSPDVSSEKHRDPLLSVDVLDDNDAPFSSHGTTEVSNDIA